MKKVERVPRRVPAKSSTISEPVSSIIPMSSVSSSSSCLSSAIGSACMDNGMQCRKLNEKKHLLLDGCGRRNFSAQFITILRVCRKVKKMETVALSIKSDPANGAYHARYVTRHTPALGVWLPPFILLHFPSEDENALHVCLSLFQWLFLPF